MLELSRRLRIYGEDRFCHGSTFPEIRAFRKILYSYADCHGMWRTRVMATRTIENEQDRRLTIMVTTFMPCSAKLPIIALVAGAFFLTNLG